MENRMENRRNPSMDVLRCVALFLVNGVHFFMYSKFYDQTFTGWSMYLMTLLRTVCMTCVPLFIMLSGFLLCRKQWSRKYYTGIIRIVGIYVLASIACVVYKNIHYDTHITGSGAVGEIFAYTAANYAWYMEMYFGLFLLIPFLNVLYHALPEQKQKLVLLFSLLALTALPATVNIFRFDSWSWWLQPSQASGYVQIVPAWWQAIYPLPYYFLGCYLREYGLPFKKRTRIFCLLAATLLQGSFVFYRSWGGKFIFGKYQEYGSMGTTVLAVLLFSLLADTSFERCPELGRKLLKRVSDLCLGGFLVSFIFDSYYYEFLNAAVPVMQNRFPWMPVMVVTVYVSSLLLSFVLDLLYRLLDRSVRALVHRLRRGKQPVAA